MIVFRKRLVFWLVREYIKKWGKTLFFSFVIGLLFFLLVLKQARSITSRIPIIQKESVGVVGTYSKENLPPIILSKISRGLTKIGSNGEIKPDIASSWEIQNNGKRYIFNLNSNVYYSDGENLTAQNTSYNFSGVKIEHPEKYTLVFTLSDNYAPFLITVSRPILKDGLVGVGDFKIKDVKLNGDFIQSITLVSARGKLRTIIYRFYPNSESLKTAFLLGEVDQALYLPDNKIHGTLFDNFPGIKVIKRVNFDRLVTVFYNTKDDYLSNRDVRLGLTYALPDKLSDGQRSYTLYPPSGWAFTNQYNYSQDLENAKLLVKPLQEIATGSAKQNLTIKTLTKYKNVADVLAKEWNKIGVISNIETVDTIPASFQVFIGDFHIPDDPDQYLIWHTGQETNITYYENKRIDKLLEDGRKTMDKEERKKIYFDFQKYLIAESPAAFLYFPFEYDVIR